VYDSGLGDTQGRGKTMGMSIAEKILANKSGRAKVGQGE